MTSARQLATELYITISFALQTYKTQKEDALAALEDANKQIEQADLIHNQAFEDLNESKEQALETAQNERAFLEDALAEKDARLKEITRQLSDKESSLEAMQIQSRKREQILSNLRQNLQYRGAHSLLFPKNILIAAKVKV